MNEPLILVRQIRVAAMYIQGYTQDAIARELGCCQSTVSNDVAAVRLLWAEQASATLTQVRDEELMRLRVLMRACLDCFDSTNNPSHMRNAIKCVELRMKLLGVLKQDVEVIVGPSMWDLLTGPVPDTIEERLRGHDEVSGAAP